MNRKLIFTGVIKLRFEHLQEVAAPGPALLMHVGVHTELGFLTQHSQELLSMV